MEIISTVVNDYDCCILGKDNLEDDVLDDGDNGNEVYLDNYDQGDFEVLHFLLQTFTSTKMFDKHLHRRSNIRFSTRHPLEDILMSSSSPQELSCGSSAKKGFETN